eukprot:Hpha_TRINITY_DN16326_c2_g7::TRINITY_DN16326_c2_g7_i1::g.60238::m.60238/K03255/TIF31, CLU1; protein TIF31
MAGTEGEAAAQPGVGEEVVQMNGVHPEEGGEELTTLRLQTPTQIEYSITLSPSEVLYEIRSTLADTAELCYVTNYDLVTDGGVVLNDSVPVGAMQPPLAQGSVIRMVFSRYDERSLRAHVHATQAVIGCRLDDMFVTAMFGEESQCPPSSSSFAPASRSYPSHQRLLGDRLRAVAEPPNRNRGEKQAGGEKDKDEGGEKEKEEEKEAETAPQVASLNQPVSSVASASAEYALDYTQQHAVGLTRAIERRVRADVVSDLRAAWKARVPRPISENAFSPGEETACNSVTPEGLYELYSQVPAAKYAVAPPAQIFFCHQTPLPNRRLQGDLAYLEIRVSGAAQPLFVTCTPLGFYVNLTKSRDEINPNPASKAHHSETLLGLLYSVNAKLRERVLDLVLRRVSMHPFESTPAGSYTDELWLSCRDPSGVLAQTQYRRDMAVTQIESHPIRDWNEEQLAVRALPDGDPDEKGLRERQLFRLHNDFVEAAVRVAVAAINGQVYPINPMEESETFHVFLVNGIFVSHTADVRNTYSALGGDEYVRSSGKKDCRSQALLRDLESKDINAVTAVIVDYKGRRVAAQPVLPGILSTLSDRIVQHAYGADEEEGLRADSELHEVLRGVSEKLNLAEHKVRTKRGEDGEPGEVVSVFPSAECKASRCADRRLYLFDFFRLCPRDLNWPDRPGALVRHELKEAYTAFKKKESPDAPPPRFNCDLHAEVPTVELADDEETLKKQEEDLKDLAKFLKEKAVPKVVEDLSGPANAQRPTAHACIDSCMLSTVFHENGVNMRYLGSVIEQLPPGSLARKVCEVEVIARVLKRMLSRTMASSPPEELGRSITSLLNAAFGTHPPEPAVPNGHGASKEGEEETPPAAESEGKKKKKKGKKGGGGEAKKAEGGLTQGALVATVVEQALSRFQATLGGDWPSTVDKFQLLRALCRKTGVRLACNTYDFSTPAPFTIADICDIAPVVTHHPPARRLVRELLAGGQACTPESPDKALRVLHHALAYAENVMGCVSVESAQGYQQVAHALYMLGDTEQALWHHHKATIITRRVFGPDHGRYVVMLRETALLAQALGRLGEAVQYMRRAMYLSKLLTGGVHPDMYATLADMYQEMGHGRKAVALMGEQIRICSDLWGKDDVRVAVLHRSLAGLLAQTGDFQGAVNEQKQCVNILNQKCGSEHQETQEAVSIYGKLVQMAVHGRKTERKLTAGGPPGFGLRGPKVGF